MKHSSYSDFLERWGVVALYVLLCVLFFSPLAAPYKLVYPLLFLTLVSLRSKMPQLTLALAFSAIGDVCGAEGKLLLQIGAFAVAQILYFLLLTKRASDRSPLRVAAAAITPALVLVVAFVAIVPAIEVGVVKIGAIVYAILIGAMVTAAGLTKRWGPRVGATLFMLSDFMLAHSLFVAPNPTLRRVSLALYFAGQLLLWLGLRKER